MKPFGRALGLAHNVHKGSMAQGAKRHQGRLGGGNPPVTLARGGLFAQGPSG